VRLRTAFPDVARPFKVPVSDNGFRVLGAICFAWVALGSWVAVFPGTLDRLFGLSYDFEEVWGVSATSFEVFTLGTLAALGALGAVGYLSAKPLRVEQRDTEQSLSGPAIAVATTER
jgi:hypothetical protein